MPATKQYTNPEFYERKLSKVMERFGVESYDWDYNRTGGWVSFIYKGQAYRFEHTVENAKSHGMKLNYGTDAFAQIVLALEDLARIINRGIYDLSSWVAGMKSLPANATTLDLVPECYKVLGFTSTPLSKKEIDSAYHAKAMVVHPDNGGSDEAFCKLQDAYEEALKYFNASPNKSK